MKSLLFLLLLLGCGQDEMACIDGLVYKKFYGDNFYTLYYGKCKNEKKSENI